MKAILCTHLGGPDDLVLADLPTPMAGAGEAVVRVKAVGLNFYDTLIARAHGADALVNYAVEDLKEALKRLGGEHGIDVVYDPVGGPLSEAALRAIAWEGRHLVVGFASGQIPKLPLNLALLKVCSVLGVNWGAWVRHNQQAYRANLAELVRCCAAGRLSCHVHAAYPLAEMAQALKALTERKVMGKVVVKP